eukprot:tig00000215_g18573.t1
MRRLTAPVLFTVVVAPPPDYRVPEDIPAPGIIRRIAREWTEAGPLLAGRPEGVDLAPGGTLAEGTGDGAEGAEAEGGAEAGEGGGESASGPPSALFATEDELSMKLAGFLELAVPFRMERLSPGVVAALFGVTEAAVAAEASLSEGAMHHLEAAAAVSGTGAGVEGAAQLEDMKRGWKAAEWLRWGSLLDSKEAKALAGISAHLRKHWECPVCRQRLIVNLNELKEHRAQCKPAGAAGPAGAGRAAKGGGSAVVDAARAMRGEGPAGAPPPKRPKKTKDGEEGGDQEGAGEPAASGEPANRRRWECETCGRAFVFTPLESLRHQRSCPGPAGPAG